jgi:GNAT superfamily N-acetyltransferase
MACTSKSDSRVQHALRIAPASSESLAGLIELLEEAAAWLWQRGLRQWEPGSMLAQRGALSSWADVGHLVIARVGDDLAGGCFLVPETNPEWRRHPGDAHHLHKLVVARRWAGRGVGAELLAWCAARTRDFGVSRLRLDCWDGNDALRAYYRDAGFHELEAVPSHGYLVRLFEREIKP